MPVVSEKPVHAELAPEQKAEQAARKAKEDVENARFARDVAVVRQLKSSLKNPASFDLEQATWMDEGSLCEPSDAGPVVQPEQGGRCCGVVTRLKAHSWDKPGPTSIS